MKIAIDISQIVYQGTGVANYTRELVNHLICYDNENEYVLFGTSFFKKKILDDYYRTLKYINNRTSAKFLPIGEKTSNFLWNKLHRIGLDKFTGRIDLFHSSDWTQPPVKAKKTTTVHDLVVYKFPETSHPYIIDTQKRRLSWVKKECDLVFADSMATRNDLVDILAFDPNKIKVVYPAINSIYKPLEQDDKKKIRDKYGLFEDYILYVGTFEPRKNIKRIAAAFERFHQHSLIKNNGRPIELVMVGKYGWGEQYKIAHKYIRVLDYVPVADLRGLYSAATFFIYPSLYEGFGLPVLEAMACGTPVITSNRGSLKEVAGNAALFCEPDSEEDIAAKMVQFFVDHDLVLEYIKKGLANASKFNWSNTIDKVLEAFRLLEN